jgi:predicted ATPase
VGRATEVAAVQDLLRREDVRLLTLTGPPGIGKTRLALQVAEELRSEFADGIVFVSLATVHDSNLVAPTIALALAVPSVAGQPQLDYLGSVIGDKHQLLVLDNFEQVLTAASFIDTLLHDGPRLKILITSREMLHLYGEREFPVPTLTLPRTEDAQSVRTLAVTPAVELFVGRAQAVKPDFELTPRNAPAVAALVACLDGLPLAIELAAARIKLFPPEEMLARLRGDDHPAASLRLLTGGPRNLPPRQQTLRDAIAWSYNLLNSQEQRLFRWLAVFQGGCTFEAVERVCGEDRADSLDVLEGVASLLDKSLIRRVEMAGGGPRLGMLETIREYASEQLAFCGEETQARQRHALYYADWAEVILPQAAESADQDLRGSLHQEHDNVLAALDWARTQEEKALFQRLFSALWESGQLLPIGAWAAAGWA